jgi:hypothetical protein
MMSSLPVAAQTVAAIAGYLDVDNDVIIEFFYPLTGKAQIAQDFRNLLGGVVYFDIIFQPIQ